MKNENPDKLLITLLSIVFTIPISLLYLLGLFMTFDSAVNYPESYNILNAVLVILVMPCIYSFCKITYSLLFDKEIKSLKCHRYYILIGAIICFVSLVSNLLPLEESYDWIYWFRTKIGGYAIGTPLIIVLAVLRHQLRSIKNKD